MAETTTSSPTQQSEPAASRGANTASHANGGFVDRMRDSATSQLTAQKDRATDGLGSVARAVRSSTQQLREQHHEAAAGYVEQIADQIERLSRGLRQKNVTELLEDAQRLARRQPAVFVASAFAAGLVAARFLKSSSPDEYGGSETGARYRPSYASGPASRAGMSRSATASDSFESGGSIGRHDQSSGPAAASAAGTERTSGGSSTAGRTGSTGDTATRSGSRPRRGSETERP